MIEDDADIVDIVLILLKQYNYEAKSMRHPAGLTDTIKTFNPHLVLVDIKISGYDGTDLCHEINAIKNAPLLVLFSAVNNIAELAKDCNAAGYISKPFNITEFINDIDGFLKTLES